MKKLIAILAVAAFAVAAQADCGKCEGNKSSCEKKCPAKGSCEKGKEGNQCPAGGEKKS